MNHTTVTEQWLFWDNEMEIIDDKEHRLFTFLDGGYLTFEHIIGDRTIFDLYDANGAGEHLSFGATPRLETTNDNIKLFYCYYVPISIVLNNAVPSAQ